MKIAMISNSWRPVRCGVTTVLEGAAAHLQARGHEVVFIAPEHPGYPDEGWPTLRFTSFRVQQDYRALAPWLPLLPSFWRRVGALGCDIVHAHDSVPFGAGYLGALMRRRLGVPLVITQHCFYESVALDHARSRPAGKLLAPAIGCLMRVAMGWALRQADLVLAPSEAAAGDVRRFRSDGVAVLPSGVDLPAARPNGVMRKRLGLPKETPLLLNVGRLHADKNLFLLLEALAQTWARVPNAVLALVGEGPLRGRLEKRARELGAGDRVRFIGPVPHEEIWGWYSSADLFVATSRETQGLVYLEAMHMGVPVVATKEGGAGSVVRHGEDGLLVPTGVEDVSAALLRCLENPGLRRSMSQHAQQHARQFDPETLVGELEGHYCGVLQAAAAKQEAYAVP